MNDQYEIKKIQTINRFTMREARRMRWKVAPTVPRIYTNILFSDSVIAESYQTGTNNFLQIFELISPI